MISTSEPSEPRPLPESMTRDEMLVYYSNYANVCAHEALQYQRRIRELEVALSSAPPVPAAAPSPNPAPPAAQPEADALKQGFLAALGVALVHLQSLAEGDEGYAESRRWAEWYVPYLGALSDDSIIPMIDGAIAALASQGTTGGQGS